MEGHTRKSTFQAPQQWGLESGLSHNDHHACRTSKRATVTQLDGLFSAYEDFAALMELPAVVVDFTKMRGYNGAPGSCNFLPSIPAY
jgi:hypothetical protein